MLEITRLNSKQSRLCAPSILFTIFGMLSVSVHASQTFEQSAIDGGDAIFANNTSGAILADNFTLTAKSHLESIAWWGSYDSNDLDDFIIRLYSDASSAPGAEIHNYSGIVVNTSSTALIDISNAPVYRYDYTFPLALELNSGTYYLSITNETNNSGWYWSFGTNGDSKHWNMASNGITWESNNGDQAFQVKYTTIVPLPSAFWLMGTGFLMPLRKKFIYNTVKRVA